MSVDYKKVAETLRRFRVFDAPSISAQDAAIDLCEQMARGELVERAPIAAAIDEADECGDERIDIDRLKHMVGGYYE